MPCFESSGMATGSPVIAMITALGMSPWLPPSPLMPVPVPRVRPAGIKPGTRPIRLFVFLGLLHLLCCFPASSFLRLFRDLLWDLSCWGESGCHASSGTFAWQIRHVGHQPPLSLWKEKEQYRPVYMEGHSTKFNTALSQCAFSSIPYVCRQEIACHSNACCLPLDNMMATCHWLPVYVCRYVHVHMSSGWCSFEYLEHYTLKGWRSVGNTPFNAYIYHLSLGVNHGMVHGVSSCSPQCICKCYSAVHYSGIHTSKQGQYNCIPTWCLPCR